VSGRNTAEAKIAVAWFVAVCFRYWFGGRRSARHSAVYGKQVAETLTIERTSVAEFSFSAERS